MTLAIERSELSAADLRRRACWTDNPDQARRLLAIAMVLDGMSREAAAKAAGMQRQTLRDWVIRYNTDGVAGLIDRPRPGRPPRLTQEHLAELDQFVESGPDVEVHGVVRWRCIDLKAVIKERFGVCLSERSVGRILGQRKFRRLSVRPQHPQSSEAVQETFKKLSQHM
jgi:transposase